MPNKFETKSDSTSLENLRNSGFVFSNEINQLSALLVDHYSS